MLKNLLQNELYMTATVIVIAWSVLSVAAIVSFFTT